MGPELLSTYARGWEIRVSWWERFKFKALSVTSSELGNFLDLGFLVCKMFFCKAIFWVWLLFRIFPLLKFSPIKSHPPSCSLSPSCASTFLIYPCFTWAFPFLLWLDSPWHHFFFLYFSFLFFSLFKKIIIVDLHWSISAI